MPVKAQRYEATAALDALIEHPRNPRRGKVEVVAESIEANGFYGAIIAQRSTGYVLAGHTRRRALLDEGATGGPVLWLECDDDTALRILLADNQAAAVATWDDRALADLLAELALTDAELAGTGFAPVELSELAADMSLPEPLPAPVNSNSTTAAKLDEYQNTQLRQVVLVFQQADYDRFVDALEAVRAATGAASYAAVVTPLVYQAAASYAAAA